jgi:hypothetical protein
LARIAIYVPDELKSRMDTVDNANWSEIARPAFESAIATFQHEKGKTMDSAIERLRASKRLQSQNDFLAGQQQGRTWTRDTASFAELRRLSRVLFPNDDYRGAGQALRTALDPVDDMTGEEVFEDCFGEDEDITDDFVAGFITGAKDFFAEVKSQL